MHGRANGRVAAAGRMSFSPNKDAVRAHVRSARMRLDRDVSRPRRPPLHGDCARRVGEPRAEFRALAARPKKSEKAVGGEDLARRRRAHFANSSGSFSTRSSTRYL